MAIDGEFDMISCGEASCLSRDEISSAYGLLGLVLNGRRNCHMWQGDGVPVDVVKRRSIVRVDKNIIASLVVDVDCACRFGWHLEDQLSSIQTWSR